MARGQSTHLRNENEHKKDIGCACSAPSGSVSARLCPGSITCGSLGRNGANLVLVLAVVAAIAINYCGSLTWEYLFGRSLEGAYTAMNRYHWRSWMVLMKLCSLDNRVLEHMCLHTNKIHQRKVDALKSSIVDIKPGTGFLELRFSL